MHPAGAVSTIGEGIYLAGLSSHRSLHACRQSVKCLLTILRCQPCHCAGVNQGCCCCCCHCMLFPLLVPAVCTVSQCICSSLSCRAHQLEAAAVDAPCGPAGHATVHQTAVPCPTSRDHVEAWMHGCRTGVLTELLVLTCCQGRGRSALRMSRCSNNTVDQPGQAFMKAVSEGTTAASRQNHVMCWQGCSCSVV